MSSATTGVSTCRCSLVLCSALVLRGHQFPSRISVFRRAVFLSLRHRSFSFSTSELRCPLPTPPIPTCSKYCDRPLMRFKIPNTQVCQGRPPHAIPTSEPEPIPLSAPPRPSKACILTGGLLVLTRRWARGTASRRLYPPLVRALPPSVQGRDLILTWQ